MVAATKVIQGKIDAVKLRDQKKAAKEQAEIAKAARREQRAAAKANVDPSTAKAINDAMR
jgi:thiamine monophosphate synthase